jgi:hypothetical protein
MHHLIEDWERESAKDLVYLQEEKELLMKEILEEEFNRKPADITVKFENNDRQSQLPEVSTITQ